MTITTERQQFAEQNGMTMEFVDWFFDKKKDGCGAMWFTIAAAMWEGWKGKEMLAARDAVPVAGESGASLQLRGLIRQRHAKWSEETFGSVGPVGPLKHLSKEALEAAAEPDDLSEWADIQFLMWDAQRRAGISDAEITAAMEEKLKVNMARQWPEPKDGEPRLHITAPPAPAVPAIFRALARHMQCAHAFIENTEAFGVTAASGILECGDVVWNIDASKAALESCRASMLENEKGAGE